MSIPSFTFTRVPSVKVSVAVVQSGLIQSLNTLVIYGRMSATPGSASASVPVQINNFGDPVAAALEAAALFGAGSELGGMVVAAISGVLYSDLANKSFPPIVCVPMVSTATSATLASVLASQLTLPSPYIVFPYPATDSVAQLAVTNYTIAINAADRGDSGQFGSFAFMATDVDTSTASPAGIAAATQGLCVPWLRDLAVTKANPVQNVAAAYGAVCASLGIPYLPLNKVTVGALLAPTQSADWHTPGDTGTVALGLASGLSPLQVVGGKIKISRSITTLRTVASVADGSYYDMQDWQVLYYYRLNAFNTASQPRYAQAKATSEKLQALKSELVALCKSFELLAMFQYVDKFADQITVNRQPQNRFAAVYSIPVNVVPGLMNIGVALTGTVAFDSAV